MLGRRSCCNYRQRIQKRSGGGGYWGEEWGIGEKELTVVQLSVQSIGGSLDKGVGDSTELRVISVTVDGVGSALLGEEKEFLEQHFV